MVDKSNNTQAVAAPAAPVQLAEKSDQQARTTIQITGSAPTVTVMDDRKKASWYGFVRQGMLIGLGNCIVTWALWPVLWPRFKTWLSSNWPAIHDWLLTGWGSLTYKDFVIGAVLAIAVGSGFAASYALRWLNKRAEDRPKLSIMSEVLLTVLALPSILITVSVALFIIWLPGMLRLARAFVAAVMRHPHPPAVSPGAVRALPNGEQETEATIDEIRRQVAALKASRDLEEKMDMRRDEP